MESTRSILLLDSDEHSAQEIQRFLKVSAFAFSLSHASDIAEGLNYIKNRKPDLILLDARLMHQKDFALFKQFAQKENIPSILLSDSAGEETKKLAGIAGAADYLVKNKINLFHLQKTIANTLKISETEAKLDNTYQEFSMQHETLYKVLNKLSSGVMVINAGNLIRYANAKAYNILGEEGLKNHLAQHLSYRITDEEEHIEIKPRRNLTVSIRISDIEWNGERANLFILDRVKNAVENTGGETYAALLNSLSESVLLLKAGAIVHANRPALSLLRLKQSDILNRSLDDVFESASDIVSEISVQSFLAEQTAEGVIKTSDGATVAVNFSIRPLNLGEEFYQLLSFTALRQTENIPGSRSEEEKLSSEGVLHLASHDLREPVRTILNYVQLISENLKNGKIEEAKEYADFAKSSAARMEKLLSDLKVYIGLNEHPFQLSKVSMKLVLADVLKNMKAKIDESQAEVSFTELPDVNADRELVEKLLTQLIDNAIKFRKKDKKPVIDIGFDKFEGNVIFCVRDNGLGISKKYYHKIFSMFEKLNRVDEYPGNGLGLAICKKITDLHGGEIWVESL